MKLTDITPKKGLKIRRQNWTPDYYWYFEFDDYFNELVLKNQRDNYARICISDLKENDWEIFVPEITESNGLRIGDTVKVIDKGCLYDCHHEMAKEMNLKKWTNGKEPTHAIGKIVAFRNHEIGFGVLCGVRINKNDFIYGIKAVKKYEEGTLSDKVQYVPQQGWVKEKPNYPEKDVIKFADDIKRKFNGGLYSHTYIQEYINKKLGARLHE